MGIQKQTKDSTTFFCFSPPVMLATFLIEIFCAIWVGIRYMPSQLRRVSIAIMVCLAVFQLAEYNVCEGVFGVDSAIWARIGFVFITLLPPLGIHLATIIARDKSRAHLYMAYAAASIFIVVFSFAGHGAQSERCLGNYVIFEMLPWAWYAYGLYYYGLLLFGLFYSFTYRQRANKKIDRALKWLGVGYLAFMVPTTTANMLEPSTLAGIPSIMCGFAVLLAIIITFVIVPMVAKRNDSST